MKSKYPKYVSSYATNLKDPRWQKRRLEILSRDEFSCRKCGATDKPLNVHHTYYDQGHEPWEYIDESLITLCEDCHKEEGELLPRQVNEFVKAFKRGGFISDDFEMIAKAIGDEGFGYDAGAISETLLYFFNNWKFMEKCFSEMLEMKNTEYLKIKGKS